MIRRSEEERTKELLEKQEALLKKQSQIQEQLKDLKARGNTKKRKMDTRRKIIAGAITLHHAETDPEYREWLAKELRNFITRKTDKDLFSDLLSELASESPHS